MDRERKKGHAILCRRGKNKGKNTSRRSEIQCVPKTVSLKTENSTTTGGETVSLDYLRYIKRVIL